MATEVEDLKTIRASLIAIVKAQTAAWESAGCPPDFSVDGESFTWSNWLDSKLKAINDLTDQIARVSSPWLVRSRGKG